VAETRAIFHRVKTSSIYPLGNGMYLIEAVLRDEVHDIHVEVEVEHPSLVIKAARSEVRNGPFTNICDMTRPNMERLVGMTVGRGFTLEARRAVGGPGGCHRISELVVEIAQAAYQLHFAVHFAALPKEVREREDVPIERWRRINESIPGMRNTCFSYNDEHEGLIASKGDPLRLLDQDLPARSLPRD
jgi:hypothetical protein